MAAAVQRKAMDAERQRFTLRQTRRTVAIIFSTGREADAAIRDRKLDPVASIRHLAHSERHLAFFRELAGIAQQVEQNLLEPHGVHVERAHVSLKALTLTAL
jgi:hypothetical protein